MWQQMLPNTHLLLSIQALLGSLEFLLQWEKDEENKDVRKFSGGDASGEWLWLLRGTGRAVAPMASAPVLPGILGRSL